jgi:hypothetical protein
MKKLILCLMSFAVMSLVSLNAAADSAGDQSFVRKFLSYKAKNKISALKTAEVFARQYKKSTDQILARFIGTQFAQGSNSDLAVVYGLEAYREQGMTMEQALAKVSDLTGQMPSTLEAMNNTSRFNVKRETASSPAPKKKLASR